MNRADAALPAGQAVILGLLHGPAELLPISSSGHITLIPWLAGWRYEQLDPELRKSFEVALHAGTAAALLITQRGEVDEAVRELDLRRAALILLSFTPAALAGLALERPIERRLGTPATIAGGLIAGSLAMVLADRFGPHGRLRADAGALDGLLLGLAQACALAPGVSRNGATLAVARLRGFERNDANVLSRHCALPIIVGAVALKGSRLARRGTEGLGSRLALGALAAFGSTLASSWLIARRDRAGSFTPYAAYRLALAAVVIRRLRENAGQ
jgi:undecaprenyl-diphosphatase